MTFNKNERGIETGGRGHRILIEVKERVGFDVSVIC